MPKNRSVQSSGSFGYQAIVLLHTCDTLFCLYRNGKLQALEIQLQNFGALDFSLTYNKSLLLHSGGCCTHQTFTRNR